MILEIYFNLIITKNVLSTSKSVGWMVKNEDENTKYYVGKRVYFVGYDEVALLQRSINECLEFLIKKFPSVRVFNINLPERLNSGLTQIVNPELIFTIKLLNNAGRKITVKAKTDSSLNGLLENIHKYNLYRNDFNTSPYLFSLGSSLKLLNFESENQFQYTAKMFKGTEGIEKIYVTQDDLAVYSKDVENIAKLSNLKFPLYNVLKDELVSTVTLMANQSDLGVVSSNYETNIDELSGLISNWFLKALEYYDKPIYFLDPIKSCWMTKSISKKRDWVKLTKFNWINYSNIGCYIEYQIIKKVKSKLKEDFLYLFMGESK